MHNTTWASNTMSSSRKKLKSQFQENFWTEVRTHLIHMTLLVMAKSPIREKVNWEALIQFSLAYLINLEIYLNLTYEITYN